MLLPKSVDRKCTWKSTCCSRSLLSVNDDIPMSYVPPWIDGMILSNADGRYSGVTPSTAVTALRRSTSNPMMSPFGSSYPNWQRNWTQNPDSVGSNPTEGTHRSGYALDVTADDRGRSGRDSARCLPQLPAGRQQYEDPVQRRLDLLNTARGGDPDEFRRLDDFLLRDGRRDSRLCDAAGRARRSGAETGIREVGVRCARLA